MPRKKKNLLADGAASSQDDNGTATSNLTDQPLKRGQAGGLAVKERYSSRFFSEIGSRGGRRFRFNFFSRLARTYDVRHTQVKDYQQMVEEWQRDLPAKEVEQRVEKWNKLMREMYEDSAAKYYDPPTCKRLMGCYTKDVVDGKFVPLKPRRRHKSKAKAKNTSK